MSIFSLRTKKKIKVDIDREKYKGVTDALATLTWEVIDVQPDGFFTDYTHNHEQFLTCIVRLRRDLPHV